MSLHTRTRDGSELSEALVYAATDTAVRIEVCSRI